MLCSKCKKEIAEKSYFCLFCGTKVEEILNCPNCGEEIQNGGDYCSSCGSSITTKLNTHTTENVEEEKPDLSVLDNLKYDDILLEIPIDSEGNKIVINKDENLICILWNVPSYNYNKQPVTKF